jgi:hypothetical protein
LMLVSRPLTIPKILGGKARGRKKVRMATKWDSGYGFYGSLAIACGLCWTAFVGCVCVVHLVVWLLRAPCLALIPCVCSPGSCSHSTLSHHTTFHLLRRPVKYTLPLTRSTNLNPQQKAFQGLMGQLK